MVLSPVLSLQGRLRQFDCWGALAIAFGSEEKIKRDFRSWRSGEESM